ncbi:MAG: 30S ribosomal protein S3 [archaeon]
MIERNFIQLAWKRVELEQYLRKEMEKAGFTRAEIIKTPLVTRIVVYVTHPGLAIGKGGQNIRNITNEIQERFKIDNPQLEIKEIVNPALDAQATADKIAGMISRGFNWRSIAYRSLRDTMAAGAQGCEIVLGGVLAGKGQRKRKQRIAEGYMKKVGEQARWCDYGKADAYGKIGAIGIKVKIVKPDVVFPDKVKVGEKLTEMMEARKAAKAEAEKHVAINEIAEKVEVEEEPKAEEKKIAKKPRQKKEIKTGEKKEPAKAEADGKKAGSE